MGGGAAPGPVELVKDVDATAVAQPGVTIPASYLVTEVDVRSNARSVVTIGDSITQGQGQTGLNTWNPANWPDHLGVRLMSAKLPLSVVNSGIAGNRLLSNGAGVSALARLDRDVLSPPGVAYVIVAEGINDIGTLLAGEGVPNAGALIFGYRQILHRAHARGIRVIVATITPFAGNVAYTQAKEAIRQDANRWIRTSGEVDGVIDFDAVVRDPADPTRLDPKYDSGDHLHPGPLGYEQMGQSIDLKLFRK
jgi:lysophospholipase L1-like esterase